MVRFAKRRLAALAASFLAAACGLDLEKNLTVEQRGVAEDAIEAEQSASLGVSAAALPALVLGPDMVLADAVAAQSDVPQRLADPSCMTVTPDGATVTYALDGCTGPWGLVKVSGTLTATFHAGPTASSFEIDLVSEGLTVAGRDATFGGTVLVSVTANRRTIDWQGSYDSKTALAKKVHHDADLSLAIEGDGAATLEGTTSTTLGARGLTLTYDLARPGPKGTCLEGTVGATTKLTKTEVTLTFDGTSTVVAENNRGGSGTFSVECTPAN